MKAAQWIDQAKAWNGWRTDYRAAQALGITRAAIGAMRSKPYATLSEQAALKIAKACDQPAAFVILDQAIERATDEAARESLRQVQEIAHGMDCSSPTRPAR